MKTKWKIVIIIVIILLGILIIKINKEERFFDKIELNNNNYVKNITDIKYLDTILKVGLDQLGLKDIVIAVRFLTIGGDDGYQLKSHIVSGEFLNLRSNDFLIEIDKSYRNDIILSSAHELIHLHQYYKRDLKITKEYAIWKGDTIYNIPKYEERPWEIEAYKLDRKLEKKIKDILYSKN